MVSSSTAPLGSSINLLTDRFIGDDEDLDGLAMRGPMDCTLRIFSVRVSLGGTGGRESAGVSFLLGEVGGGKSGLLFLDLLPTLESSDMTVSTCGASSAPMTEMLVEKRLSDMSDSLSSSDESSKTML